jgi:SAM-dependent methyltransferase
VFTSVAEYPAVLICACAIPVLRLRQMTRTDIARDVLYAVAIAGLIAVVTFVAGGVLAVSTRIKVAVLGVVAIAIFSQLRRPLRFSLMLSAMLLTTAVTWHPFETVIHAERTFFGSYHVSQDARRRFHVLYHGTTVHGMESLDPLRQREPLTYYYRSGPFGQAFERLPQLHDASDIAAVGLGVGSLAAYAGELHRWTFYEIDPAVERIARDDRYFRFLSGCGSPCRVVLGDARLSLARSNAQFDAIVLDAFSSDSIPVHLVTREALDMYLRRLKPGGLLMFHISNRYLRLDNVLGRLAGARGLEILIQSDRPVASAVNEGYSASDWVIASPDPHALDPLASDSRWTRLQNDRSTPLWTDDFSNILTVLRWGRR